MNSIKTIATCLLFFSVLGSCNTKEDVPDERKRLTQITEKQREDADAVEVGVEQIRFGNFEKQLVSNGKLCSAQKAELRFERSGIIQHIFYKNGDWVGVGKTIATLDTTMLSIRCRETEEAISQAYIELFDKLIIAGKSSLADTSEISSEALQQFKSSSGLTRAKLEHRRAKRELQACILKAPFSGLIANIELQTYDQSSSSEPFCTLINPNAFYVDFSLLESELASVSKNQKLSITPFSDKTKHYYGVVETINPMVDEHAMVKVSAKLKQSKGLFEGQNVKVYLEHRVPEQLIVSKEALVVRSNRTVLFLYKSGVAQWVYVDRLFENDTEVAVKGALHKGDSVIVFNNLNLAHETRVKLSNIDLQKESKDAAQ